MKAIIIFLLMTSTVLASSILDKYPQTTNFELSTGETILLPLHFKRAQGLMLIGTVDYQTAAEALRAEGLFPLPISGHKAMATIFVLDYPESSIGPYREALYIISSSKTYLNPSKALDLKRSYTKIAQMMFRLDRNKEPSKDNGSFVHRIELNEEFPIIVGREVWGYPKTYSPIDFNKNRGEHTVKIWDEDGKVSLELHRASVLSDLISLPAYYDVIMFTPKSMQGRVGRNLLQGGSFQSFFSKKHDRLILNPQTELGAEISRFDFKPLLWTVLNDMDIVTL